VNNNETKNPQKLGLKSKIIFLIFHTEKGDIKQDRVSVLLFFFKQLRAKNFSTNFNIVKLNSCIRFQYLDGNISREFYTKI